MACVPVPQTLFLWIKKNLFLFKLFILHYAFTYTSDFTGGCPPLPLSEKRVSLQLQLIIPGCDSVSTYKLLWKSSSLPE